MLPILLPFISCHLPPAPPTCLFYLYHLLFHLSQCLADLSTNCLDLPTLTHPVLGGLPHEPLSSFSGHYLLIISYKLETPGKLSLGGVQEKKDEQKTGSKFNDRKVMTIQ